MTVEAMITQLGSLCPGNDVLSPPPTPQNRRQVVINLPSGYKGPASSIATYKTGGASKMLDSMELCREVRGPPGLFGFLMSKD